MDISTKAANALKWRASQGLSGPLRASQGHHLFLGEWLRTGLEIFMLG